MMSFLSSITTTLNKQAGVYGFILWKKGSIMQFFCPPVLTYVAVYNHYLHNLVQINLHSNL